MSRDEMKMHVRVSLYDQRDRKVIEIHTKEAGTYPNPVKINNATCLDTFMLMPADAVRGQTSNLILQVTNDGVPPLTRYQRVVFTCR